MIRLDVLKKSWRRFSRRLENVLKTSSKRREDVLKMSWRRFCKISWRRLENVLKTSWRRIAKTNILVLTKTSWRHLEDVLLRWIYSSWSRRLEDEDERRLQEVLKTSSSRRMFSGKRLTVCWVKNKFPEINISQGMIAWIRLNCWTCVALFFNLSFGIVDLLLVV